jgi:hypothetical protein
MDINKLRTLSKLSLLFLAVALFSCSKEAKIEQVEKATVVVAFDKLQPISEMRVFTGGTKVLDPRIDEKTVQNFLDRNYSLKTNAGVRFYQSKFVEPGTTDEYGKSAFIFYNDGRINYGAEIIKIKSLADTRIFESIVTNKIEDNPIVTSDLFKYKFVVNSNGTYNYQYVVHGGNQAPEVSLLYYKLVRYDDQGNLKSLAFGTVHNELNESFVRTLTQYDTLAVKAYKIDYTVK